MVRMRFVADCEPEAARRIDRPQLDFLAWGQTVSSNCWRE
jgi:hypothetical protein